MPCKDEQIVLDKFYLLVCRARNWQLFVAKEPCFKASHPNFWTSVDHYLGPRNLRRQTTSGADNAGENEIIDGSF
jgi:hypothetical protein